MFEKELKKIKNDAVSQLWDAYKLKEKQQVKQFESGEITGLELAARLLEIHKIWLKESKNLFK